MSLIINADDLGWDSQTNKAIIEAFRTGFCSSATLMPNMPGFKEACELIHENKLVNHIGLHLVLRDGLPVSEKIKRFPVFCDSRGRLCLSATRPIFLGLWPSEKRAIAEEIRAQIECCRAKGIKITHLDSHYHIHAGFGIASVLIPIAKEEGIKYIRIARNFGPRISFHKKIYKNFLNSILIRNTLARTAFFGNIPDYLFSKNMHHLLVISNQLS
ncbi:MAG: ChbG/HpnK family deacetylase [Atribacterota bacterium]|nr:ChbG/HpnK family deacetylase [Atribacterota bacterium]